MLGETYIDIDSSQAKGTDGGSHGGDILPSREVPDFGDMVRSGQGTLQNMDALLKSAWIASSPSSKAARARSAS